MHLLDTDTLTYLFQGNAAVAQRLQEIDDPDVGTTVITKIEMLRGRYASVLKAGNGEALLRAHELLLRTEQRLSEIVVIGFGDAAANRFDELRSIRGLGKVGNADLLIASVALINGATLVTRNLRHFRAIPGLKLANWVD
jgi:tRNA(fMet)-specific endonuclease VapC